MMESDLMVGGELVLTGFAGDDFMGDGFTYAGVVRALSNVQGDLTVRLNSPGGYATDGAAIHAALKRYEGRVTVLVEGIAASSASLLAMAADEIVMAQGAMMMVHDPSGVTIGPADEHRRAAATLDSLAETYADVYAARSSRSKDEVRALMLAETWMGPDEAVSLGFADRVEAQEQAPATAAFDYRIYARAPAELCAKAEEMGWTMSKSVNRAVAPKAKEATMADDTHAADQQTPAADAQDTPAPTPTEAPKMSADKPIMSAPKPDPVAERRLAITARFGDRMTAKRVDEIAMSAQDVPGALMAAADDLIEAQMKGAGAETREPIRITSDERERNAGAMIDALRSTMFGGALEGPATQYRGLTMKKLAIELSGKNGSYAFNDMDMVKEGMRASGVLMAAGHSTSDFAYITSEVMGRELRSAYTSRPGTWSAISRVRTAADFRSLYSVQAGGDFEMKKIAENGEYQGTVLTDAGETFKVERYGRKVLLTFEAVINDDLGAFARLPQDFARGARNLESRIAWSIITANGNLSDGMALFATAAGRKNLAASGAALSAATVGAARKAMWEQRPLGAKSTSDDFISAVPNLLFVPPALEITAMQFTSATVPDTDANVNPFKGTLQPAVEPRLGAAVSGGSDTAWYLFDSSLPVLEHAFLQGYETPTVEAMDKMDPDGVTMIARHIFGAGAVEFRGAYKNAGA